MDIYYTSPNTLIMSCCFRILIYSGSHQRLLSLARCSKVTNAGIDKLPLCQSLLFLNFSYTQIEDISSIAACVNLRGVNLAGTKLQSYDSLKWLIGLEVLNLNNSAIDTIGDSFSELRLLRSLDLGNTQLTTLRDLEFIAKGQITRLEELYLDGTQAQGYVPSPPAGPRPHTQKQKQLAAPPTPPELSEKEMDQELKEPFLRLFDKIAEMSCLRVVNIGNSPAAKYVKHLQSKITNDRTFVLSKPRSYYWFLNVINNEHEEVRAMILNGMDVNQRAGPSESELFLRAWQRRCGGKTPFFDCLCVDQGLRPTALHVAVFFNSVECLKHLVKVEARQACAVWLGGMDAESCSESASSGDEDALGAVEVEEVVDQDQDQDLTSDEGDEDRRRSRDGSSDSDDMTSLGSTRSDYAAVVEKRREQRRVARARRVEPGFDLQTLPLPFSFVVLMCCFFVFVAALFPEKKLPLRRGVARARRRRVASLKPSSAARSELEQARAQAEMPGASVDKVRAQTVSSNATTFAKRVYDENVHRFTEQMTERRITGWKLECKGIQTRLQNILAGDADEFDDDYLSTASVGSVAQVSVATELSRAKLTKEAARKKVAMENIQLLYDSKRAPERDQESARVLAKHDPTVTDDDLFLCSLRRDSNGDIVGTRGQFVSEEMIRLQLQTAQSERALTGAEGSLASYQTEGTCAMFPELFATGGDDLSVITHDTAGKDNALADDFFPHIPALEQCSPWEPLFAKLAKPVVVKVYKHETDGTEEGMQPAGGAPIAAAPKNKWLDKKKDKDSQSLLNALGMEYVEINILGKKSHWLESRRDLLRKRVQGDEVLQLQEERYKAERWKTFISDSVSADGKVFGRDSRVAKPMKILHNSDGSQLSREERKQKLAQMLKENREMYVL